MCEKHCWPPSGGRSTVMFSNLPVACHARGGNSCNNNQSKTQSLHYIIISILLIINIIIKPDKSWSHVFKGTRLIQRESGRRPRKVKTRDLKSRKELSSRLRPQAGWDLPDHFLAGWKVKVEEKKQRPEGTYLLVSCRCCSCGQLSVGCLTLELIHM